MKKNLLAASLALATVLSACTNDKTPEPTPVDTLAIRIQKKWMVDKLLNVTNGSTGIDSFEFDGNNTDYLDFKPDGKIYTFTNGIYDTLDYKIISDDTLELNHDQYRITTLTENNFNLYYYYIQSDETEEIFIKLKK